MLSHSSALTAADLSVKYDQSQLLWLPRPAVAIIIGNPAMPDIAIQSGATFLVVTGKSFGMTLFRGRAPKSFRRGAPPEFAVLAPHEV